MSDLSAADIAEGRRLLDAVLAEPSPSTYAPLLNWAAKGKRWAALLDAAETVRALKALHSPDDGGDGYRLRCCTECLTHWPCATSRAINTGEAR